MTTPSMFKRAYVRGVNDELIRLGALRYISKTAADEVADAVGDAMPVEPATEDVPADIAGEVAATLIDAAQTLVAGASADAGVPEGEELPPEMAEHLEEAAKQSAAADIDTRASDAAVDLMQKAAAQTKQALGSTIEGGNTSNAMADSIQAETMMEAANRPANKYVVGVGNTGYPVGQGNVGTEQVGYETPGQSPAGTNSVIQQSKMGSALAQVLRKYAMGSTIEGGDKGNDPAQAASVTGEAALDNMRRPQGSYLVGVGNTGMTPGSGVVGSEQPHEDQPGAAAPGSNSVTEFSASNKSGSYDPFLALFETTAQKVAEHLPNNLSQDEKVAQVRQMMGYTDEEIVAHIGLLHKQAGATDDQAVAAATEQAKSASAQRPRYAGPGSSRTNRKVANQKNAASEPETAHTEEMPNHGGKGPYIAKKAAEDSPASSSNLLARIRSVSQAHLRS